MRCGITTGSCAAAASKAAAMVLFGLKEPREVLIRTPAGDLRIEILCLRRSEDGILCGVKKDAGDDPDVTDGAVIESFVSFAEGTKGPAIKAVPGQSPERIRILGGPGVGRVTRPGLDQPVGEAAINSAPRRMIREAVQEAWNEHCESSGLQEPVPFLNVQIRVPGGEELAEKTFNPKLGITGGISILGTRGIVIPMSDDAILETIRAEIRIRAAEHFPLLAIVPGSYGKEFLKKEYGFSTDLAAECSNYIRDAALMAAREGFTRILLIGHAGKLIKVAGGVGNTHSRYGDRRMEITASFAGPLLDKDLAETASGRILSCAAMDEAVQVLMEFGISGPVFEAAAQSAARHVEAFSGGKVSAEVIIFSNRYGVLGKTPRAEHFLKELTAHEAAKGKNL